MTFDEKYHVRTMQDVANFCGVSLATVQYWAQHDGLPRDGTEYNLHAIIQWLCKRRKSISIVYERGMEPPLPNRGAAKKGAPTTAAELQALVERNVEREFAIGDDDGDGLRPVDIDLYKSLNEKTKYEIHQLSLSEKRKHLVRSEAIRAWMGRLAGVVRGFADVMERQFGPEGLDIHDQLCDRIIEQIPTLEDESGVQ